MLTVHGASTGDRILSRTLRDAAVALAAVTVAASAWISDDALITLRSVTNAVVGNGATFNPVETVQSFTHPLWFLLLLGANSIVLAPAHWAILLGLLFFAGLIVQLVRAARGDALLAAALVLVVASLPAVVEWATSGLENSLAMFLVASLALVTLPAERRAHPLVVGLVAAALVLTRLDLALIVAPLALAWVWRRPWRDVLIAGVGGALPLVAWFTWSWSYYGFLLPNTYYAKLNVDIPATELLIQGLSYVRLSLARHPLLTVVLVLGLSVVARSRHGLPPASRIAVVSAVTLYLAYVVRIGGDFMEGRFFGVVVVLALVGMALAVGPQGEPGEEVAGTASAGSGHLSPRTLALVLIAAALVAAVARTPVPWLDEGLAGERWDYKASGYARIADERGFYVARGQSFWSSKDMRRIDDRFRAFERVDGPPTEFRVACGMLGREGVDFGPSVHIVDTCGLTDPLLARIPYQAEGFGWRVGHYQREVPEGYLTALESGDAVFILDPDVRDLADALWAVVRR